MYMNTYIIHMNAYVNIYENCQGLGSQKHGPTGRGSGLLAQYLSSTQKNSLKRNSYSLPP